MIVTGKNRKYLGSVAEGRILPSFSESILMAWTFLIVLVGWIIFRANNITDAWHYISRMFTNFSFTGPLLYKASFFWIFIMLLVEWFQRNKSHAFSLSESGVLRYRAVRWSIYYAIIGVILCFSGISSDFIYFQF